jgi:hypothetical protein
LDIKGGRQAGRKIVEGRRKELKEGVEGRN